MSIMWGLRRCTANALRPICHAAATCARPQPYAPKHGESSELRFPALLTGVGGALLGLTLIKNNNYHRGLSYCVNDERVSDVSAPHVPRDHPNVIAFDEGLTEVPLQHGELPLVAHMAQSTYVPREHPYVTAFKWPMKLGSTFIDTLGREGLLASALCNVHKLTTCCSGTAGVEHGIAMVRNTFLLQFGIRINLVGARAWDINPRCREIMMESTEGPKAMHIMTYPSAKRLT